jgi:ribosomal protein S18 acetylase RimI-like enzyme
LQALSNYDVAPARQNLLVTSFQIRPISPAEHDALGEVSIRSYLEDGLLLGGLDDPYAPNLRDVALRAASATVLVAVDGDTGAILGGVTLAFHGSAMAQLAGPGEAEIRMLAVDPGAQGRGVGSALAVACVERARTEEGTKRVVLCSQQAMTTAHRLYARLGFERAPELDWYPLPEVLLWGFRLDL